MDPWAESEPLIVAPTDPRATHKRPWWNQKRIAVGGNPFASFGLDWCRRCQSEQDCDTQAQCGQDVYVYKRTCCRCGAVVKYGVCQIQMVSERPLPAAAFTWILEPGKDRR